MAYQQLFKSYTGWPKKNSKPPQNRQLA